MSEAPEEPKARKGRRTPEELAAHYQRLANQTRARAAKAAKDALVKKKLELGDAALEAGLSTPAQVAAAAANVGPQTSPDSNILTILGKAALVAFGQGRARVNDESGLAALVDLGCLTDEEFGQLRRYWRQHNLHVA